MNSFLLQWCRRPGRCDDGGNDETHPMSPGSGGGGGEAHAKADTNAEANASAKVDTHKG